MAEIRRGKKKKKKDRTNDRMKILWLSLFHRAAKKSVQNDKSRCVGILQSKEWTVKTGISSNNWKCLVTESGKARAMDAADHRY